MVTLTAVYAPDETPTSLIYDLNYSHYAKTSPCGYEEDADSEASRLNNSKITLRAPTSAETLPGYDFGGWYLAEDLSGSAVTEVLIDHNAPTPNVVYAKWTTRSDTQYAVEFYYEVDGAYPATPDARDESRTATTDSEVSVTDADKTPTKDKYILDDRDKSTWTGTVAGDGSLTLKVYFRRQYTITYDPNGGTINGSTRNVEERHFYGDKITIIGAPVRTYYEFLYWKGSQYQPGDSYTVKEDHLFVAQWKWKNSAVPLTGDDSRLELWQSVCAMAALGLGISAFMLGGLPRKKKGRH